MIEMILCLPLLSILVWAVPSFWQKLDRKAQIQWEETSRSFVAAESIQSQTEKKLGSLDTIEGLDLLTAHSDGALAQSVEQ
jgi:hypothetical protein